jgi:ferrous iron transport protein B
MTTQYLIVFTLVAGCSVYALWTLMPISVRRLMAKQLMKWPLGSAWKTRFQQAASASSGCDCSGCDKVVDQTHKKRPQVVHFHTRTKD